MKPLLIEIWSDIACPWCYVGKRRLDQALSAFAHREATRITWRSFELDPAAPPVRSDNPTYAQRLAIKYDCPLPEAEGMLRRMTETAAADGLDLRFDRIRPGNTFDAHRLLHLAKTNGLADALQERLLKAYLCEGEAIGERATLTRLATATGLDADLVGRTLASDAYTHAVRADEAAAVAQGVQGVPFFVIGKHRLSGAHPPEALLAALTSAWPVPPPEQQVCGPEGCG